MKYRLIVLTHGESEPLAETLASFLQHVWPLPTDAFMHIDGPDARSVAYDVARNLTVWDWTLGQDMEPVGFCGSCRQAWNEEAAHGSHDFVFWLEHDFRFLRDLDLRPLAEVLDADPTLAQMALMRNAVNEQEKEAGGLYESRPGQYRHDLASYSRDGIVGTHAFLRHRSYFTTNPSLMRRAFVAEHRWPDYQSECEGRFGIDLVEHGFSFGVWGDGQPWVEHVGVRSGYGY